MKLTTVEEKSLALAELMGWKISVFDREAPYVDTPFRNYSDLAMYEDSERGLAQFAAILLKFPEVMELSFSYYEDEGWLEYDDNEKAWVHYDKPTQSTILDEILRINGYEVE